jgi:hypothetical protein
MVRTTQRGSALGRVSALQGVLQLPHVVLCLLQPLDQVVVHFLGDRVVLGPLIVAMCWMYWTID